MKKIKVCVIGCVLMSKDLFLSLNKINNIEIVGVITKKKSNYHSDFYSLKSDANQIGAKVFLSQGKEDEKMINFVKNIKADLGFCIGWSHLFSKKFIKLFNQGIIGFHPSKLPLNKGKHPIIWSLFLGLKDTASSFFLMDAGVDTGVILSQNTIKITRNDDATSLYKKISKSASKQILNFLPKYLSKKIKAKNISKEEGNIWRKRSALDGRIDWRMSYKAIENLVKALQFPYPGAYCNYSGNSYKVSKIMAGKKTKKNIEPGKVIKVINGIIHVKCWDRTLCIVEHSFSKVPKKGEYLL